MEKHSKLLSMFVLKIRFWGAKESIFSDQLVVKKGSLYYFTAGKMKNLNSNEKLILEI